MNKEDIKKAFDICYDIQQGCTDCPLLKLERQNGAGCKYNLFVSVIDLITEQEKEIEQLKDDYAKLQELFAQYQMASDKEIIAQKKEAEKRFENNMKSVLEIEKKQAVKDFAEELKAKTMCIKEYEDGTRILQTSNKLIDQSVNIFLTNY